MCDIPTFDPYVKLMEEWRDFQWRKYLLMLKTNNTTWDKRYIDRAIDFNLAMRVIQDQIPAPKDERLDEFKHFKYQQYPDDCNVPEMD